MLFATILAEMRTIVKKVRRSRWIGRNTVWKCAGAYSILSSPLIPDGPLLARIFLHAVSYYYQQLYLFFLGELVSLGLLKLSTSGASAGVSGDIDHRDLIWRKRLNNN